jgi:hypothetical protein
MDCSTSARLESSLQIDKAIELGNQFQNMPINQYAIHSIGIDPGFSSSRSAIVVTEFLKEVEKIRVVYAEEFDKSIPQDLVNLIFKMYTVDYGMMNTYIWVDGANRAFVNLLKVAFDESLNWEKQNITPNSMKVLPVNFGTEHKQMLSHSKGYVCIPSNYDKLIISLRTAWANELSLDKEQTSYSDSLDALRLS